jgi:hypothetical protein
LGLHKSKQQKFITIEVVEDQHSDNFRSASNSPILYKLNEAYKEEGRSVGPPTQPLSHVIKANLTKI